MTRRERWAITLTAAVALAPLIQSDNQPIAFIYMLLVGAAIAFLLWGQR
jgi:hypothetical protein